MRQGSLTVVGLGIRAVAQVTPEALSALHRAERLYYLVTDPITERWLQDLFPAAESLFGEYRTDCSRVEIYDAIATRLVVATEAGERVCAAGYGHPGVCASPWREAIRRVRASGHRAEMMPGVSALDSLYADLNVDPVIDGSQTYEATRFLLGRRIFDPCTGLILLQVGLLGQFDHRERFTTTAVPVLVDWLIRTYGGEHSVVLYEAAMLPVGRPRVERLPLRDLPDARLRPSTTLYVPPLPDRERDAEFAARLATAVGSHPGWSGGPPG